MHFRPSLLGNEVIATRNYEPNLRPPRFRFRSEVFPLSRALGVRDVLLVTGFHFDVMLLLL